jgi:hypothetical protein
VNYLSMNDLLHITCMVPRTQGTYLEVGVSW